MSINRTQHEVYYGKTDVSNNQELLNFIKEIEMSNKKKIENNKCAVNRDSNNVLNI